MDMTDRALHFFSSLTGEFFVLLIIISVIAACFFYIQRDSNASEIGKRLPGPKGLPIFGYLPFFSPRLCINMCRLKKYYGDVFKVPIGMQNCVFLNSYSVIQEALVDNANEISESFTFESLVYSTMKGNMKSTHVTDPVVDERSHLAHRVVIDHTTSSKSLVETIILDAARELKYEFSEEVSNCFFNIEAACKKCVTIIEHHVNAKFVEPHVGIHKNLKFEKETDILAPILFPFTRFHPWLRSVTLTSLRLLKDLWWNCMDLQTYLFNIFDEDRRERIESISSEFDFEVAHQSSLSFLVARHQFMTPSPTSSTSSPLENVFELLESSGDTTAKMLNWILLILSFLPGVHENVQSEIDEHIGRSHAPKFSDLESCHYINAVIDESLRMSSISPFGMPRMAKKDIKIKGFFIPKGSLIIPNIYAVHRDPELWTKPELFMPNRFINPSDGAYRPSENLIVFEIGRGNYQKTYLKMQLFLIMTVWLQAIKLKVEYRSQLLPNDMLPSDGKEFQDFRVTFQPYKSHNV